jgi:cell division protease FtsH
MKNLIFWAIIFVVLLVLFQLFAKPRPTVLDKTYSDFLSAVDSGRVHEVEIRGRNITWKEKDGKSYKTYAPEDPEMIKFLREKRIVINAKKEEETPWYSYLINWFPMLLLIGLWLFFMRQVQVGGGKALSFGKSKAKVLTKEHHRVTFEHVAGIDEAKGELEEIISFLRDPKRFTKLGGRIPKGVLLIGAPGTGKTLLARAIAGEADVPFFTISGSDFVEMFVGVGASRVRDLFLQGKRNAPCIIFIDEIDAVGRHRGAGLGGGHDEREQTLNQLLVEMDGFESNDGVILIAATNRPDVLDPALLRPGRFDRQVVVPVPDVKGREQILGVHARRTALADGVDLSVLARGTPGFTGADLENLVNEAALLAARLGKDKVEMIDFDQAKDKVMMGVERKSMIIPYEERRNTAYHEAGHTLVARMIPGTDPIHKVTIIPRGRALGITQQLPIDEKHTYHKQYLLNNITVMMGGRAAEKLILDHLTTGAGNDIERSTDIARKMVCEWGMSDKIGPLACGQKEEQIFLGREFARHRDYSEETARLIDDEVREIVTQSYERAKNILNGNMAALHRLANALLEKEVLDGDQIDQIIKSEAVES